MMSATMTPSQRQAASLAWQHSHPLYIIAISTAVSLIIVSLIVVLRWLFSIGAWKYHPGGAGGFLKDEAVRLGAIFVPWLFLGIFFKYYIYELHPELNTPATWGIFAAFAIGTRLILRRLPFIKAMARHIDAARAREREVKRGTGQ